MLHSLKKLLLAASLCALPFTTSQAQVNLSINFAPPPLPVYEQPLCPVEGYLWTPGYWSWADEDYYWVPGAWVEPPRIGYLWTPGYWGFADGLYAFHTGYWGPTVGFYGGVNYGFGYGGNGYDGGRWDGGRFRYNTAVTRVNTTVIHNTYVNKTVINRTTNSRASFNGPGGVRVQPTAAQRQAADGPHLRPTEQQVARRQAASKDRNQFASVNRGQPQQLTAASAKPLGINARSERQEARIANGRAEGALTGRQTRRLEDREVGLQRQVNAERQSNRNDMLTPEERQLAQRRENRLNREIYRDRQAGGGYNNSPVAREQRQMRQGEQQGFRQAEGYETKQRNAERQQMHRDAAQNYGQGPAQPYARQREAEAEARVHAERQAARAENRGKREERKQGDRREGQEH